MDFGLPSVHVAPKKGPPFLDTRARPPRRETYQTQLNLRWWAMSTTLRNNKRYMLLVAATAVSLPGCLSAVADDGSGTVATPSLANAVHDGGESRVGFRVERYSRLWERNPFTLPSQTAPETRRSPFENLFLTCWLIDSGKEVICVENSETKDVQTIGAESNQNNLRLVELRRNVDPRVVEAVISDGKGMGTVKFRYNDQQPQVPMISPSAQAPTVGPSVAAQNPAVAGSQAASRGSESSVLQQTVPVNQPGPYRIYPGMPRVYHEGGGLQTAAPRRKGVLQNPATAQ